LLQRLQLGSNLLEFLQRLHTGHLHQCNFQEESRCRRPPKCFFGPVQMFDIGDQATFIECVCRYFLGGQSPLGRAM